MQPLFFRVVYFCTTTFILTLSAFTSLNALSFDGAIQAESAILINGKTGKIIWAKNPDIASFPASTTKIATAFYALMQKPNALQEPVIARREALITVASSEKMQANYTKCPSFWLEKDGSHVGIKTGQVLTFEELLLATLIASGNDASNIIAQTVSGSIEHFMEGLNRFIKNLGCTSTYFCNPHGLHHPNHVTTARDMARIAQCAMYHPFFRKAVSQVKYEKAATATQNRLLFVQTNKLLQQGPHYYPSAIGIKTGYTSKAGHALVAAAEQGDRMLIAVIFKAKDKDARFKNAKMMFDACFQETKVEKVLLSAGQQQFSRDYEGAKEVLVTYTNQPLTLSYYPSEEPQIRSLLVWDDVALPIKAGAQVGHIRIIADEKEAASVPLFAKNDVEHTLTHRIVCVIGKIANTLMRHPVISFAVAFLLILGFFRLRKSF